MCDFAAMLVAPALAISMLFFTPRPAAMPSDFQLASSTQPAPDPNEWDNLPPEEKMKRRYPQPVKVGFLIGLPVLDWSDSTLGHVRKVVRTPEGKIRLIVAYGRWLTWRKRLVAVPIETVAILGRQINALEMQPDDFEKAPTWNDSGGSDIATDATIQIAISRR